MAKHTYFNRELSWLEFNQRVLEEAKDSGNPLLERLKFIAITSSNLDEFFMVRVGGLKILKDQKPRTTDPAGMTASAQLDAIGRRAHQMVQDQHRCYREDLEPNMAKHGIRRRRPDSLSDRQLRFLDQLMEEELYPVITPMAVDGEGESPLLANRELYMVVRLKEAGGSARDPLYAFMPIGRSGRRFISLPSEEDYEFILLEDVVGQFVDRWFPGYEVLEAMPFRITRNADMSVQEDLASDLLSGMEEVIRARKLSDCVRLEIDARATKTLGAFMKRVLNIREEDVYRTDGPQDFKDFMSLAGLKGYEHLQIDTWPPQPSPEVEAGEPMMDTLSRRDVLLYHPYESFDPVVRFVNEAADDPDVLAIKQILYRTSRRSPIVTALMRAAENGKYVTAIVELKARFDEEQNIGWARTLEEAGVQVIYGIKGLKTHAKLCLIIRREDRGLVRYMHFGTGNYNDSTAKLYSDVSFMTSDAELGRDAATFFNTITGYSQPVSYRKLSAAPLNLRDRILGLIESEIERKTQGQKAHIMAKVNSLVDPAIIRALYNAGRAGVPVDLNIRGICCLRPGVPGLSENIRVVSIVDRFLEHARIMYFLHGGESQVLISSADWMPRNLDRRIELLTPVEGGDHRKRLTQILESYFADNRKSWTLQPDGRYVRTRSGKKGKGKPVRSQELLYKRACQASENARKNKPVVFEPHRPPAGSTP